VPLRGLIRHDDLSEPILASCAMADGAIFVRTESSLHRIE